LQDPAAMKSYEGLTTINGKDYYTIKVTFKQDGGGEDFDDEFFYWFHKESFLLDYLAYNYTTEGGGVRFRQAYNRQTIDGFVFQDYVNYKPSDKATPLDLLPELFQDGKLIELSRIENAEIKILPAF
jgi:hypothetical protein